MARDRLDTVIKDVNKRNKGKRGIFFFRLGHSNALEYVFENSPKHVKK